MKHVCNGIASEDLYQSVSEDLSNEHVWILLRYNGKPVVLNWIDGLSLSLSQILGNLHLKKRNFYRNIERWPSNVTNFQEIPNGGGFIIFDFYFNKIQCPIS